MKYGYHTPERTTQFCRLLNAEGIAFTDESWANDETDRIVITGTGLCVWMGNPEHPDYKDPELGTNDNTENYRVLARGDFQVIIDAIKTKSHDQI